MSQREIDELSGVETTGHEWDGIKELNNPLPRWWLWTFYVTILFSIGYMVYYPSIPLIESSTWGISGVTNRKVVQMELKAAEEARAGTVQQILDTDLEGIRSNEELFRFAVAGGGSMFKVYCSQCHGSGAQGAVGYPNLNDDDWVWGGDLESIYTSIAHGIRNGGDEARDSMMPNYGADELLDATQVSQVTEYVLQVSGQEHDAALASAGATVFADNCAACHGDDGKGMREVGAPNLTDAIWLYEGSREAIASQLNRARHGVMPGWVDRLGEASVKQLAVYIHSLGGGEASGN